MGDMTIAKLPSMKSNAWSWNSWLRLTRKGLGMSVIGHLVDLACSLVSVNVLTLLLSSTLISGAFYAKSLSRESASA